MTHPEFAEAPDQAETHETMSDEEFFAFYGDDLDDLPFSETVDPIDELYNRG